MANKALFKSLRGKFVPKAEASNNAGGKAYALTAEEALAQYAMTGTLNGTFYASGRDQLDTVLKLAWEVSPEFLGKLAVYAAEQGFMKDMPALLLSVLSSMQGPEFDRAFGRVVTNGKMLRNFVQIMRSGATGRKSLGTRPKRAVASWLNAASNRQLMFATVGNSPSLADVIKMVHPKPEDASRAALYAYLIGRPYDVAALPANFRLFEDFKRSPSTSALPDVPFHLLSSFELSSDQWKQVALSASWQTLRQGLNMFLRNGVFADQKVTEQLAAKLRDPALVARAKVMPYQLFAAIKNISLEVPLIIREALEDALELSLVNVPSVEGSVVLCPDVSGSMQWPMTGYRGSATTKMRCIDVAGLMASAFLRVNRQTQVLPFDWVVHKPRLSSRDSVATNAEKLAGLGGGGTNCSLPLKQLADRNQAVDLVVMVSDNESWMDPKRSWNSGTEVMAEWERVKKRNPQAKLVCVDVVPNATTQAVTRPDILNVGGFSDQVFKVIDAFATVRDGNNFVRSIDAVEL